MYNLFSKVVYNTQFSEYWCFQVAPPGTMQKTTFRARSLQENAGLPFVVKTRHPRSSSMSIGRDRASSPPIRRQEPGNAGTPRRSEGFQSPFDGLKLEPAKLWFANRLWKSELPKWQGNARATDLGIFLHVYVLLDRNGNNSDCPGWTRFLPYGIPTTLKDLHICSGYKCKQGTRLPDSFRQL